MCHQWKVFLRPALPCPRAGRLSQLGCSCLPQLQRDQLCLGWVKCQRCPRSSVLQREDASSHRHLFCYCLGHSAKSQASLVLDFWGSNMEGSSAPTGGRNTRRKSAAWQQTSESGRRPLASSVPNYIYFHLGAANVWGFTDPNGRDFL